MYCRNLVVDRSYRPLTAKPEVVAPLLVPFGVAKTTSRRRLRWPRPTPKMLGAGRDHPQDAPGVVMANLSFLCGWSTFH